MGRNPKIRLNFDSDVQYLLRLKHAVEEDKGYPQEYRNQLCSAIQSMVGLLLKAPPKKGTFEIVEETPRKKRARA